MNTFIKFTTRALIFAAALIGVNARATLTDISNSPLVTSSGTSVKPNILYVLDNSGSMAWDYMPDNVDYPYFSTSKYGFASIQCNGVYYDPTQTYALPVHADGTTYPASSFIAAPTDGFSTSSTMNLTNNFYLDTNNIDSSWASPTTPGTAYYYNYTGSQTTQAQKTILNSSSTYFKECNTTVGASTTITVSGSGSTSVSSIMIGKAQLMSGTSTASTSTSTVAANIAAKITQYGYSATSSGSTVTISGPFLGFSPVITQSGAMTLTPSPMFNTVKMSTTETTTITVNSANAVTVDSITVNGIQLMGLTSVAGGTNTSTTAGNISARMYAASGAGYTATSSGNVITITGPASAANYVPIVHIASGSMNFTTDVFPDTNAAHLQNFANWYTYYRTRLQMMKSAAGLVFQNIDNRYRVGFTTISDSGVNTDTTCSMSSSNKTFLMISDFDSVQKSCWYTKFYGTTVSGSTPLRTALAKAGQIYAGKWLTGTHDPVQYSCQQNFTILSTDGYWNDTSNPNQIDKSTDIGEQDALEARPMYDGAGVTYNVTTSQTMESQSRISQDTTQIQADTTQVQSSSSTLQQQTSQLQTRTDQLQISTLGTGPGQWQESDCTHTKNGSCSSWGSWYNVTSCTTSSTVECHLVGAGVQESDCTNTRHGSCSSWGAWYYNNPCSPSSTVQCQIGQSWSAWSNAASCATSSTTQCQYLRGSWTGTSSCTSIAQSPGPNYTVATARECQTAVTSPFTNVSSCVVTTTPGASGNTTQCQYSAWGAWTNASSCTEVDQSSASPYTVATAIQCQTTDTGWVGVSSCPTASTGQTVTCRTTDSGWVYVASCSTQVAYSTNNWTTIGCNTQTIMAPTPVDPSTCTAAAPSAGNNYVTTTCTPSSHTTSGSTCTPTAPSLSNNWTTTTCGSPSVTGGTYNTLADVAEYYWKTDLRTSALGNCTGSLGIDVCQNDVPGAAPDINPQQHMTTFTLGLGADGTLQYTTDYLSGGSADYNAIKAGTLNWPDPTATQNATRIDDLWHAAVDGRGIYYSAKSAASLVTGLSNALAGVTAREGSSSSAATSSLEPVAGDNFLYIASYRTGYWDGDLQARTIDVTTDSSTNTTTATISATTKWSAQALLDGNVSASSDTRTIYTYDTSYAGNLKPFLWGNLTSAEQSYFTNMCTPTALLSQCPTLSPTDLASANSGQNLVNYLRGQSQYAGGSTPVSSSFRTRQHALGDMVDSQPEYVKVPPFNYLDTGYTTFQGDQASRNPEVYVAANDGMLHAFDGVTGQESWAYIPPFVLSNLYRLADNTYSVNHRFFVDGSPVAGDIYCTDATLCSGGQWKTILVGGQNAGGRGYYALDITDPAHPKALWNFTSANDSDLGYTFGNPIIAKRKDGTWVVVVTSGYNNVSPGSGQGFVFVLNAFTGTELEKIGTGVGSTGSPSGLAKINAWINDDTDKTASRYYAGDLLGELWRITLDPAAPANSESTAGTAFMLAQVGQTNGAGNQPITTVPQLTTVTYEGSNYSVIEFGTGEYLGLTDLTDTSQQSVYAIKDILGTTSLGQVRASPPAVLVQQVMTDTTGTNSTEVRTITNNPVDWSSKDGWYVDLNPGNTSPGERVNIDPQLNEGLLTVATNVPTSNACDASGYAFLYYFDFKTGSASSTAIDNQVGQKDTENSMVAGMNFVYLQTPGGGVQGENIVCTTDATCHITIPPPPPPPTGGVSRFSWRELVQ